MATTTQRHTPINWRDYIHADERILAGRPIIRGTRLAADFVLDLLAAGWSPEEVLTNYPDLTPEALRAVFALAAECMKEESWYSLPLAAE